MTDRVFLDTNVFLYAGSRFAGDRRKSVIARQLMRQKGVTISTQVLQEFINAALRKKQLGITEEKIDLMLRITNQMEVVPISYSLILKATLLRRRFQLSHWDSTIVAAGIDSGCPVLYSEDLSHGQLFEGMKIVNPFLAPSG